MMGFLDGAMAAPAVVLVEEKDVSGKKETTETPNPAYAVWYTQDQQVLSFLVASLSREVVLQVIGINSSAGVWKAINQMFASQSRAKVIQLRGQLNNTRKGDLTIATYFTKMKSFADELATAGKPLDEDEVVSYILGGLDADFNSFVLAISVRPDQAVSLGELFSILLTAEARLEAQNGGSSYSANLATKGGPRGRFSSGGSSGSGDSRIHGNGGRDSDGGDRDELKCQLCKREGDGAWSCFKRFDKTFNNNPKRRGGGGGNNGGGCGGGGRRSTNAASSSYGDDTNWYLASGATDHVTGELEKLVVRVRYTGNDRVHTASGEGMEIAHIGRALLPTPHRSLRLNNILHVPSASQSLLSAYRLMIDNQAFLEIHPEFFSVKDQETGNILLRARSRRGLFPVSGQLGVHKHQALGAIKPSTSRWHRRLGHPSLPVVQKILRDHSLPVSNRKSHHVCYACQMAKSHQLPYSRSTSESVAPLELIFSDVWGPGPVSIGRQKFYVSFIDAFSKFSWIYLLKHKSDVFEKFHHFQQHV